VSDSDSESDSDSDLSSGSLTKSERERRRDKRREKKLSKQVYQQVKHVFAIDVKELKNIPVLTKFIKEAKDYEAATLTLGDRATYC
jgi:hypothetical protein